MTIQVTTTQLYTKNNELEFEKMSVAWFWVESVRHDQKIKFDLGQTEGHEINS